jgi:hypothetical protein
VFAVEREDDADADAEFAAASDAEWARLTAGLEAGTEPVPPEPEDGGQGVSLSLGDACDLDPALLAVIAPPPCPILTPPTATRSSPRLPRACGSTSSPARPRPWR